MVYLIGDLLSVKLCISLNIIVFLPERFWQNTNSCLQSMALTEQEFRWWNNKNIQYCSKRCRINQRKPVIINDFRSFKLSNSILDAVNQLNLSVHFTDLNHFTSSLYRLILNPRQDTQELILQQLRQYPSSYTAIHLRTGGYLANFKEIGYWVKKSELPNVVSFIKKTINSKQLSKDVYLSTDSDYVEQYLKKTLHGFHMLPRMNMSRNHATRTFSEDAYKGTLFDMFISAHASHFFSSPNSGFSIVIQMLSHPDNIILPTINRYYKQL